MELQPSKTIAVSPTVLGDSAAGDAAGPFLRGGAVAWQHLQLCGGGRVGDGQAISVDDEYCNDRCGVTVAEKWADAVNIAVDDTLAAWPAATSDPAISSCHDQRASM